MESAAPGPDSEPKLGVVLRLGFYIFLIIIGVPMFAFALSIGGDLITAAGATFAAGLTANALSLRVFERMSLPSVGLGWGPGTGRNLGVGFAAGVGAAMLVTVVPVLVGAAHLVTEPDNPANAAGVFFVSFALLFGAVGEELIFRGYGFQILAPAAGRVTAIAVTSVLFGLGHTQNLNVSALGIVNTIGFGVVLGFAMLRSGDLWLPTGLHFGWNLVLPLAGVNLSGFNMGVTGYSLRWNVADLWSGGEYGPEASVLTCGILVMLFWFLAKAPVSHTEAPLLKRHDGEG